MGEWLAFIQTRYAVNPWVFLALYALVLPLKWYGAWRMIVAARRRALRALRRWALLVAGAELLPYVYVLLAGRNFPRWLYLVAVCFLVLLVWEMVSRVRRLRRAE